MKIGALVLFSLGSLSFVGVASAQVPRARVGFQMDVRTGVSVPLGKAEQGGKMSDLVGNQVPVIVDIGGKVIPELFLGGYFGLGFGGPAGQTKDFCDANDFSCLAVSVQLGIEAQYQIIPAGRVDPWIGYGFGFESLALSQGNGSSSLSYGGFEFARIMAGVDFRVNRVFGVGPFFDLSMGQYSTVSQTNTSGLTSANQDIGGTTTHEWLTFGARFVFFP
jgi:hypothetical protein